MNLISRLNHEGKFQRAWADPSNTRFELPPVRRQPGARRALLYERTAHVYPHHAVGHGGAEGMEARPLYPLRCMEVGSGSGGRHED